MRTPGIVYSWEMDSLISLPNSLNFPLYSENYVTILRTILRAHPIPVQVGHDFTPYSSGPGAEGGPKWVWRVPAEPFRWGRKLNFFPFEYIFAVFFAYFGCQNGFWAFFEVPTACFEGTNSRSAQYSHRVRMILAACFGGTRMKFY